MTESSPVKAVHSSSVTNGMTGCSSRSSWSSTKPSTCRVVSAAPASPEASGTLASSRYQSQTSSQAKWYSTSQTLPNSNASNSWSVSAITADSRDSIHRSGTEKAAGSGAEKDGASGTRAPLSRANRTAFQSLLQKLRDPPPTPR